jgi:hypothetical protein
LQPPQSIRHDSYLETMRRDGTLHEFNAAYKSRRAAARGEGFIHSRIFFSPADVSGLRNPIVSWSLTVSRKKRLLHLMLTDRRKAMSDKPRRLLQEIG